LPEKQRSEMDFEADPIWAKYDYPSLARIETAPAVC
jgi:hypothetical protein